MLKTTRSSDVKVGTSFRAPNRNEATRVRNKYPVSEVLIDFWIPDQVGDDTVYLLDHRDYVVFIFLFADVENFVLLLIGAAAGFDFFSAPFLVQNFIADF